MKEIYLDWDWEFGSFIKSNRKKALMKKIREEKGVKQIWLRQSSSGRTHAKIVLEKPVGLFESFLLRAHWRDDAHRLACDLDRYYRLRETDATNRIFSCKITASGRHYAGNWQLETEEA